MLIDTNVWSELTRPRPDPRVAEWMADNFDACLLSTLVLAEIRFGLEQTGKARASRDLQAFHDDLIVRIGDRLLPFDAPAATEWGRMKVRLKRSGTPIADMDMLIASQAIAAGVPLVTRNRSDMQRTGAILIDPWGE